MFSAIDSFFAESVIVSQRLIFFSEDECTRILNTNKIKRILSTGESKIRERISVKVDYDGSCYEVHIVRMHGKFNNLKVYTLICF